MNNEKFVPAIVVGVSLILSTVIGAWTFSSVRSNDTISVTGSAKQQVVSDTVKWNMGIMRTVSSFELKSGYAQIAADLKIVQKFLKDSGIADSDITISPVSMDENYYYDKNGTPTEKTYNLRQPIIIDSKEVDKVEGVAKNVESLVQKGVMLSTYSMIQYFYSKVPELRVSLLANAVRDAKARAEKILEPSGGKVGKMRTASSGVVQVLPVNSVEVSDYGMYDTQSKNKDIMVTVRAAFDIK
ncbi:MAG TPA: SIMPL domain-containing protein [Candidatus Paceibacterota bacterium]